MFGLVLLAVVILGLWLTLSLIGLVFKLIFGLVGGMFWVFGGFIGLLFAGIFSLVLLPVAGLLMLPLLLPALVFGTLIWLLLGSSRRPVVITQYR